MSIKNKSNEYFATAGMFSQQLGAKESLLAETACMSLKMRKFYVNLDFIEKTTKNQRLKELITTKIKPLVKAWGYAEWQRDIVSDMGLKVPVTQTNVNLTETGGIEDVLKRMSEE